MPASHLTVVVTRRLPEVVETRMKELFDVELRDPDVAMTREELAAATRRADVLVPTITDTIDAGLLAQAGEKLKLIAKKAISNALPACETTAVSSASTCTFLVHVRRITFTVILLSGVDGASTTPFSPLSRTFSRSLRPATAALSNDPG